MIRKAIIYLPFLAGCATVPEYDVVQPSNYSTQDSRQHLYECQLQARTVLLGIPYVPPNTGGGVVQSITTHHDGFSSGMATYTTNTGNFSSGFVQGLAQGVASRPRVTYDSSLIHLCLEAKGYRFVQRGDLEPLPDTDWVPQGYRLVRD